MLWRGQALPANPRSLIHASRRLQPDGHGQIAFVTDGLQTLDSGEVAHLWELQTQMIGLVETQRPSTLAEAITSIAIFGLGEDFDLYCDTSLHRSSSCT